jgi:hypothetical protein
MESMIQALAMALYMSMATKVKRKVRHNKYISPEKWKKLSKEDYTTIYRKHDSNEGKGEGYRHTKKKEARRQASAATKVP